MNRIIERELLKDLKDHLSHREISLIVGPRQAGKTTLMMMLSDYLVKAGERTFFLNLDVERDRPFFDTQTALLNRIKLEFGASKGYIFIDEIQRKENAGLFLKGIFDLNTPYKFIVSGSGSLELKEKIHESLAGRKRVFELNPVSFREFFDFRTGYRYQNRISEYLSTEQQQAKDLLNEYLNFGGYPRVLTAETLKEKIRLIDEIYQSYIEKDIAYFLKVEKVDAFRNMIRMLASQTGGMLNVAELSNTLGLSAQTVKNYLFYAEKTFIIQRLSPFYRNTRKEISKSPVIYFRDAGFRNYAHGFFGNLHRLSEMGFLFQNLVLHALQRKWRFEGGTIHFWRTKDRAEVDFVIRLGDTLLPVEVKCQERKDTSIGRSLRNFIHLYNPKEAWVVTLAHREELFIDQTRVMFIPFYDLA